MSANAYRKRAWYFLSLREEVTLRWSNGIFNKTHPSLLE